jgi:hypothetical protein
MVLLVCVGTGSGAEQDAAPAGAPVPALSARSVRARTGVQWARVVRQQRPAGKSAVLRELSRPYPAARRERLAEPPIAAEQARQRAAAFLRENVDLFVGPRAPEFLPAEGVVVRETLANTYPEEYAERGTDFTVVLGQEYRGIPVFESEARVAMTQFGEVWQVVSHLAEVEDAPAEPALDADGALAAARGALGAPAAEPDEAPQLYVHAPSGLVWRMSFLAPVFREVLIDAMTGEVVLSRKNVRDQADTPSLMPANCFAVPTTVAAGGRLSVYFLINNPGASAVNVGLWAGIRRNGTSGWTSDPDNDVYVSKPPGVSMHTRYFDVPADASSGNYDVCWRLWETIGEGESWDTLIKENHFAVEGSCVVTLTVRDADGLGLQYATGQYYAGGAQDWSKTTDASGVVSETDSATNANSFCRARLVGSRLDVLDEDSGGSTVQKDTPTFDTSGGGGFDKAIDLDDASGLNTYEGGVVFRECMRAWSYANMNYGYDRSLVTVFVDSLWGPASAGTELYFPHGRAVLDNGAPSASAEIDDTMLHEYGHALQYGAYGMSWGRPPGCTCVNHGGLSNDCSHDALVEGWASYFAVMLYNQINPSDTSYGWTDNSATFDIELNANTNWEERDEWSVVGMLFDVYDSVNESGDTLALGDDEIWTVFWLDNPGTVEQFFQRFVARYPEHADGLVQVFKTHGMSPDWLTLSTDSLDFGASATEDTFSIQRLNWYGDGVIVQPTWEITKDVDWITDISPASGSTTTETDTITATVSRASLGVGTYTGHITVTPTYYGLPQQITVTCMGDVTDDDYEPNDTYEQAYDLSGHEGAWLSDLDGSGIQADDDWFEINVSPAGSERVLVDCTFTHANGNVELALHDSSGALLTAAASSTDDEHIDYVVPSAGTHYIRVYGANTGSSYDLRWECQVVPDLSVTSPNGGESWTGGEAHTLTWSWTGDGGAAVEVELLKGGALDTVIAASTPDDGSHSWSIPLGQTTGSDYRVRVGSVSNASYTDQSNGDFTITEGSGLAVLSPNGGESWQQDTTHSVTWDSSGSVGASVKLELYKGGSLDSTIAASTANDGAYSWTIPAEQATGSDYKVKVTSTSVPSYYDYSDAAFAVTSAGSDASFEHGVVSADENWVTVDLANTYTDPIVIAGPATYNGSDPGVVRLRNVSADSFQVRFQEWDYLDGGHKTEQIGYMAVERGVWEIGSGRILVADSADTGNTDPSSPTAVGFPGGASFSSAPVVVATQQTADGGDAVTERLSGIGASGFSVCLQEEEAGGGHKTETVGYVAVGSGSGGTGSLSVSIEAGTGDPSGWQVAVVEEQSKDNETNHASETVGHIRFTDSADTTLNFVADMQSCNGKDTASLRCEQEPEPAEFQTEHGAVTADEDWVTVSLTNTYTDPIVIAGPATYNGSDPGVVRVRNVAGGSFQICFQEWNYLDGGHAWEEIAYLVVERGVWDVGSGRILVAGSVDTGNTDPSSPAAVSFPGSAGFTATPVVVATQQTANGGDAVTERLMGIGTSGFSACLQEEEAEGGHTSETVGYVALGEGTGGSSASGAALEAATGSTPSGWEILVVEEQSKDSETGHCAETVAYLWFTDASQDAPYFVADMQGCNGNNTASLRCQEATTEPATEDEPAEEPETAGEAPSPELAGWTGGTGASEAGDRAEGDAAGAASPVEDDAPLVRVLVPAGGPTGERFVTVQGAAEDESAIEAIWVNGVLATPTSANYATWEATVPLDQGWTADDANALNRIAVSATDERGNFAPMADATEVVSMGEAGLVRRVPLATSYSGALVAGDADTFQFEATAGTTLDVALKVRGGGDLGFGLELRDPWGDELAVPDQYVSVGDGVLTVNGFPLPATGLYTLSVEPEGGEGDYLLELSGTVPRATLHLTASLSEVGDVDAYALDAVAGSALTAQAAGEAAAPALEVLDPTGQSLPLEGHLSLRNGKAMLKALPLALTGRYVVKVLSREGAGQYVLTCAVRPPEPAELRLEGPCIVYLRPETVKAGSTLDLVVVGADEEPDGNVVEIADLAAPVTAARLRAGRGVLDAAVPADVPLGDCIVRLIADGEKSSAAPVTVVP